MPAERRTFSTPAQKPSRRSTIIPPRPCTRKMVQKIAQKCTDNDRRHKFARKLDRDLIALAVLRSARFIRSVFRIVLALFRQFRTEAFQPIFQTLFPVIRHVAPRLLLPLMVINHKPGHTKAGFEATVRPVLKSAAT